MTILCDQPQRARSYRRRDVGNTEVIYPVIVEWDREANDPRRPDWKPATVLCSSIETLDGVRGLGMASYRLLEYYNGGQS